MEQVVKCMQCGQYYMYTPKDTECPFCHTAYVAEVIEEGVKEPKKKKITVTTNKESFKLWRDTKN